jgi:hypothetical protein
MQITHLQAAMERSSPIPPVWNDVLAELLAIITIPLTADAEQYLLKILAFSGELYLDEKAEMPHRCSPETMLKSLAVQALCRWTGIRHLTALRQLQITSPYLSDETEFAIRKAMYPD